MSALRPNEHEANGSPVRRFRPPSVTRRRERGGRSVSNCPEIPGAGDHPGGGWWTSEEENGHWVLVVSKEEFQVGFDAWGFRQGELKQEVLALLPEPPSIITAAEITKRLSRTDGGSSMDFLKAVQRYLRELREGALAQSVPHGTGGQLGWHLPGPGRAIVREQPAPSKPASPAKPPAADKPKAPLAVREGASIGLQRKLLHLLPTAPTSITASGLAALLERQWSLRPGEAQKLVQSQLRELQLRRLVRGVRIEGQDGLGWCRL